MMKTRPSRGEIWLVRLNPIEGSEQGGTRPFLIIQRDVLNEVSPVTIGFPLTSHVKKMSSANVLLTEKDSGLPKPSLILTNQIRSLSMSRLEKKLGKVHPSVLNHIEKAFFFIISIPISAIHRMGY